MMKIAHVATVDLTHRFLLLAQLERLLGEGHQVTAISAPGPWVRHLEDRGIRHISWPSATRSWAPRKDARAFVELVGIFRSERFDLVHTHNPKPGVLGRIAAWLTRTPYIVNTVHGLYTTPEDRIAKRWAILGAERCASWCSDLELYQSQEDFEWATRIRLAASKITLLGNGIDLVHFDPDVVSTERRAALKRELGIPSDALVIGAVGRLVAEKGYRELFRAAADVRRSLPEAAFLVVGESDEEKWDSIPPEEVARAKHDVTFAGWREDVRDLLAIMDIFVLPSWREGLPRSAIEAAAMGVPMILTDIRGCREVVRHGVEGLLIPPREPRRLAEAILQLARDHDARLRMGAAARTRARARFDERRVASTVVEQYRRLAGAEETLHL